MGEIFYYISKDLEIEKAAKKVIEDAIMDNLSVGSMYNELCDSLPAIHAGSNTYIELKGLTCIKVDYEDEVDGTLKRRKITGYSIGYKPPVPVDENKEDTEKCDIKEDPKTFVGSYKGVFVGSALLLTGFILGKRSNKLRPLKKRERYVEPNFLWRRYPDIPNDTRVAIRDEVFDFIFDFMKANDIHFAKRRK